MGKTVTWDRGATSITIKAHAYPERPGRTTPQLLGFTIGGGVRTADLGGTDVWERPILNFVDLSTADYESLRGFIESTLNWSQLSFTYTDPHGTAHTAMHYVGGLPEFRSSRGPSKGLWSGTIELHKDMTA